MFSSPATSEFSMYSGSNFKMETYPELKYNVFQSEPASVIINEVAAMVTYDESNFGYYGGKCIYEL